MKELLQQRLSQFTKAIEQKKQECSQANADLNVLLGHATELSNVIALHDQHQLAEDAKKLEAIDDSVVEDCNDPDHVHCEALGENCEAEHIHCEAV
jgi:hypothetical protein